MAATTHTGKGSVVIGAADTLTAADIPMVIQAITIVAVATGTVILTIDGVAHTFNMTGATSLHLDFPCTLKASTIVLTGTQALQASVWFA